MQALPFFDGVLDGQANVRLEDVGEEPYVTALVAAMLLVTITLLTRRRQLDLEQQVEHRTRALRDGADLVGRALAGAALPETSFS